MDTTTTADAATHDFVFPEATALTARDPAFEPAFEGALNPEPGWGDVVREQLAATGLALRREGLVVAAAMAVFTLVVLLTQAQDGPAEIPLDPRMGIPAAMMALLIPLAVWKGEGPEQRGYHHGMPVDQGGHAVMRGAAGLAWTLAGVAAFFGWMGMISLVTGGSVQTTEPWQWLAPFAGAAVTYLLGSAVTLKTTHPWRWLGGTAVGFFFLNAFWGVDALRPLVETFRSLLSGHYGLFTLLTGLVQNPARGDGGAWFLADFGAWLTSLAIWGAVGAGAFLWAAWNQPEK